MAGHKISRSLVIVSFKEVELPSKLSSAPLFCRACLFWSLCYSFVQHTELQQMIHDVKKKYRKLKQGRLDDSGQLSEWDILRLMKTMNTTIRFVSCNFRFCCNLRLPIKCSQRQKVFCLVFLKIIFPFKFSMLCIRYSSKAAEMLFSPCKQLFCIISELSADWLC